MATTVAPLVVPARRPTSRGIAAVALGLVGAAATAGTVWVVWRSPVVRDAHTTAVVKGLLVASYIAVGAYTWWRRPRSRLGPLVAAVGLLYAFTALGASTHPVPFALGRLALTLVVAYFVYLFLCFPRDRLTSRSEERFVLAFGGATAIVWALVLGFARTLPRGGAFSDCTRSCPENPFRLVDTSHGVTDALNLAANAMAALALAALIVVLLRRAHSPAHLRRRAVVPLFISATLLAATYASYSVATEAGHSGDLGALRILSAIGALSVPLALLVGQIRGRIFAAVNLWRLLAHSGSRRLTPLWVEGVLGSSLGDPSFALALWDPERRRYVDARGAPLELPSSVARSVTAIERNGRPALALIHDPALDDEPEIVEGLGATAVVLLENTHLVEELEASRARIVQSAERERLRLERDLHDGAQQRLMAIQIKLAIARETAGGGELVEQLDELASDASAAVEELRELAHGIYPTVLRERGLADALRVFAKSVPIPVRIVDEGFGRAASGVEVAVYYCLLEAIQNAVKHAGRSSDVTVTLARSTEGVVFEAEDGGVGFDPAAHFDGIGLVTMRDRIAAVGGVLAVESSAGGGARVFGSVPIAHETGTDRPQGELGTRAEAELREDA